MLPKLVSAWLPIAMSLAAFGVVVVHVALFGTAREPDEGTAAHGWQILMAAQIPIIAFFAFTAIPRAPRQALPVLALQIVAVLWAMAPVYYLGL